MNDSDNKNCSYSVCYNKNCTYLQNALQKQPGYCNYKGKMNSIGFLCMKNGTVKHEEFEVKAAYALKKQKLFAGKSTSAKKRGYFSGKQKTVHKRENCSLPGGPLTDKI